MAYSPTTSSTALIGLVRFATSAGFRGVTRADRSDGSPRGVAYPVNGPGGSPVPRNAPCPCGSGRKFKACCREG